MGLVVALIAQFIEPGFEVRFVIAQLKRRQYTAVVGTVATIVEQRNIPVRAQGVRNFSSAPGDSGNSKLQTLL
jgi:hypothetical protein